MTSTTIAAMRPRRPLRGLRGASAALLLTVAAAGCSSTGTGTPAPAAEAGPAHAHGAPTGLPASGDLATSCTEPSPDGGDAALDSVELISEGDQLVIAFTMAEKIDADLTVRVTARPGTAVTREGQPALTVTAKVQGAIPVSLQLTTPTGSGSASAPQDHLHVVDNQLHIGVPSSILSSVGPQWNWSAAATSGAAHSQCPASAGSGGSGSVVVVD